MKKIYLASILVIGAILLAGCSLGQNSGNIKIGMTAPLTGEGIIWGQNTLAGAQLAIKEFNDAGGLNGRKAQLIVEDDKAGGTDAVTAFNKLINIDNVSAITGVVSSVAAGPALPIAQNAKIPVVFLASAPSLTSVGDYMFRIYPADNYEGSVSAELLSNKFGKKKVAVLYVKNDYGEGVSKAFVQKFNELGGQVSYQGALANDSKDFRSDIAKVKASKPDSLYLVMYPDGALILSRQLKEAGVKLPTVTDVVFNDEKVIKSGYSEGFIYAEPSSNVSDEFTAKIKSQPEFKDLSVMVAAPYSYDATKAVLTAIKDAGSDNPSEIREALTKITFPGETNSSVSFDANREVRNPVFKFMIINNKQAVPYNL